MKSILTLALFLMVVINARGAEPSCKYDNDIFLLGPDNGIPIKKYSAYKDPHAFKSWEYDQILFCERADSKGSYIIVTDSFHVANPPQEILEIKKDELGWIRLWINTDDKGTEVRNRRLELIMRSDEQFVWLFRKNPYLIGGMPL